MASCTSSSWTTNSTSPRIKLVITENTNTDTYVKYNWELYYIAASAASSSVAKSWTVKVDDGTATGTYNIGGKTGTHLIKSGTKKIQRGTSAKTITFSCSMNIDITWSGVKKTTISASGTFTLGKKTSYTVSYNANGGSDAPSNQTKWYGTTLILSTKEPKRSGYTFLGWGTSASDTSVNYAAGASYTSNAGVTLYAIWSKTLTLTYSANGGSGGPPKDSETIYNATTSKAFTLSSTKPTRTGYTFLGWSTSSTATSASYSSGGNITISANTTLYAVWKIITYTVSYNANGGSGAPSSQTKNYGTALTLSSTKPTRTNYNFKGWATSANGSVEYSAGGSYTANAAVTLYAVWEIAYIKPRITNLTVKRYAYEVNSEGTIEKDEYSDIGESVYISFNWASDYAVSSISTSYKLSTESDSAYTQPIEMTSNTAEDGKSGTVSGRYFDNLLSIENAFVIKVKVTDTFNTTVNYSEATKTLPATKFILDFKNGGNGVAIGKPADKEGFECEFDAMFNGSLTRNGNVVLDASNYSTYCAKASHTHNYAGSSSAGGAATSATKVNTNLVVKLNGGTTEGTNMFTFNGSAAKSINITPSAIGASASHSHPYLSTSGGTVSGALTVNGATTLKSTLDVTGNLNGNGGGYFDTNIRVGNNGILTTEYALATYWKDNAVHNLASRATDGLTSYFGWAGSSSYASICNLRSRTVRYSNSSGTTTLSDERLKKDFTSLDKWSEFFDAIEPCAFRMKTGNSGRFHLGYKAQQIEQALIDSDLTTQDFAGFIKMAYLPDSDNEDLRKAYEEAGIKEGEDELGLVYTEFVPLNTYKIQKLNNKVKEQQEEIDSLNTKTQEQEEKISKLEEEMRQLKELVAKLVA